MSTPPDLENLIDLMARLPGLGPRSARRAVLHLVKKRALALMPLADALARVAETARECLNCGITISDGTWIIALGKWGWLGFIGLFGMISALLWLALHASKRAPPRASTAALALMTAANLMCLIPNSTLTPIAWLCIGALAGFAQFAPAAKSAEVEDGPKEDTVADRRPRCSRFGPGAVGDAPLTRCRWGSGPGDEACQRCLNFVHDLGQPGFGRRVAFVRCNDRGQPDNGPVSAPGADAINHQPVFRREIPGQFPAPLFEPVMDHHPGRAFLDDGAIGHEWALHTQLASHVAAFQPGDFPAAARQTDFGRVD